MPLWFWEWNPSFALLNLAVACDPSDAQPGESLQTAIQHARLSSAQWILDGSHLYLGQPDVPARIQKAWIEPFQTPVHVIFLLRSPTDCAQSLLYHLLSRLPLCGVYLDVFRFFEEHPEQLQGFLNVFRLSRIEHFYKSLSAYTCVRIHLIDVSRLNHEATYRYLEEHLEISGLTEAWKCVRRNPRSYNRNPFRPVSLKAQIQLARLASRGRRSGNVLHWLHSKWQAFWLRIRSASATLPGPLLKKIQSKLKDDESWYNQFQMQAPKGPGIISIPA